MRGPASRVLTMSTTSGPDDHFLPLYLDNLRTLIPELAALEVEARRRVGAPLAGERHK